MWKSTFSVAEMDCPAEEQLVRLKLEGRDDVTALEFNPGQRQVDVIHTGDPATIATELATLRLGSTLIASAPTTSGATSPPETAERRLLWQVLLINLFFFVVEAVAGIRARSMGLVADSLDMFADGAVYAMALYAVGRSARHKGSVATISGVLQMLLALLGLAETLRRFITPDRLPGSGAMIGISSLALLGNVACLVLLQRSRSNEAHMQASMIFTSSDVMANAGVIVAGILVLLTASRWPDLVVGLAIFLLIVRGALRIFRLSRA